LIPVYTGIRALVLGHSAAAGEIGYQRVSTGVPRKPPPPGVLLGQVKTNYTIDDLEDEDEDDVGGDSVQL
jgi:hypothetical protein